MLVGTIQIEFLLPGCLSLKEKRVVVKSLKTKIRNRFNVSVAEVAYQDKWQRSILAVANVSNEKKYIEEILNKILRFAESETRIEVLDHLIEIF